MRTMCVRILVVIAWMLIVAARPAPAKPYLYMAGLPSTVIEADIPVEVTGTIRMGGAEEARGISFTMIYDASRVEVLDADDSRPGVNLQASAGWSQILENQAQQRVDGTGTIEFIALSLDGAPQSGDIDVAMIRLRIKRPGTAHLVFQSSEIPGSTALAIANSGGEPASVRPELFHAAIATSPDPSIDITAPGLDLFAPEPGVFNPLASNPEARAVSLSYRLGEDASVWAWVENGAGQKIRNLENGTSVTGVSQNPMRTATWDGRTGFNTVAPDGTYVVKIYARDSDGNTSRVAQSEPVTLDSAAPVIHAGEVVNRAFSPNGDGIKDRLQLEAYPSEPALFSVTVMRNGNAAHAILPQTSVLAAPVRYEWQGNGTGGDRLADGIFRIEIKAQDRAGNTTVSYIDDIVIDTVAPVLGETIPGAVSYVSPGTVSIHISDAAPSSGINPWLALLTTDTREPETFQSLNGNMLTSAPLQPMNAGAHTLSAEIEDVAGNFTRKTWVLDIIAPPDVQVTGVAPAVFNPVAGPVAVSVSADRCVALTPRVFSGGQLKAVLGQTQISGGGSAVVLWDGLWSDGQSHEGVADIVLHGAECGLEHEGDFAAAQATVDTSAPEVRMSSQTPAAPGNAIAPGGTAGAVFAVSDNFDAAPEVAARVVNAGGAAVRTLAAAQAAGGFSVSWDGLVDDAQNPGQLIAPADGMYYIELSAVDDAKNQGSARAAVRVDGAGPSIVAITPAAGADAGSFTTKITARVRDASGVDVDGIRFYVDGSATPLDPVWEATFSEAYLPAVAFAPASGNAHSVRVVAQDVLGNETEFAWNFNIDTTAPALAAFAAPAAGAAVGGAVSVAAEVADNRGGAGIARTELVAAGQTLAVDGAGPAVYFPPLDVSGVPDGPLALTLRAIDKLGNTLESAQEIFVDNTPPQISGASFDPLAGVSPTGNSQVKSTAIAPAISEAGPFSWILEIGTGLKSDGTFAALYTAERAVAAGGEVQEIVWAGIDNQSQVLPESMYTVYVTAADTAGNEAQWQGSVAVDSQAPAPVALETPVSGAVLAGDAPVAALATDNLASGGALTVTLILTPEGGTARRVTLTFDPADGKYKTLWSTGIPDDGVYAAVVEAVDGAGNKTTGAPSEIIVANAPAAIANVRDVPDPFAPDTATGNSPDTLTAFSFAVTTGAPVAVDWTLEIGENAGGTWTSHKTFSGTTPAGRASRVGPLAWDGIKDDGVTRLGDGAYAYRINAVTVGAGQTATYEVGVVTLDSTPPVTQSAAATPAWFAPEGYGASPRAAALSAQITEANAYKASATISCAAGNTSCAAAFGADPVRVFEQDFPAGAQPSFTWDGKSAAGGIAPDGGYAVTFRITDAAGNTSGAVSANVEIDNPPRIAVQGTPDAFSPNGDGVKDLTALQWSTDQDGVFTIEIYRDGALAGTAAAGAAYGAGTHTVQWPGPSVADPAEMIALQGAYAVKITGRDASRADNECAPREGVTLLDIEAPDVAPYYPLMHDFTWERPKIKVNITDNLSGLGDEAEQARQAVAFTVSEYAGALASNVRDAGYDPLALRAWAQPEAALPLTHGPHELSVTAVDRAGNTGRLSLEDPVSGASGLDRLRFVAIAPLRDEFADPALGEWVVVPVNGGGGSVSAAGGALIVNHANSVPDAGGAPIDIHGYSLVGRGVYDVSRQHVVARLDGVTETGGGDIHAAGVALVEVNPDGGFPRRLYLLRVDDKVMAFYEDAARDSLAWLATVEVTAGAPVDLKIEYEEGVAKFFVNDVLQRTAGVRMTYATVGITALSGFEGAGGSSSRLEASAFWSDLAAPRMNSVRIVNAAGAVVNALQLGESYRLRAEGTPWQMPVHVSGRTYNAARVGQVGNVDVALDKLTVQGPAPLTETAEGAGVYESGLLTADAVADAQGYETGALSPFAANRWFDILPLNKADYVAESQYYAAIKTNAVLSAEIKNADAPEGTAYAYILPGESWRVAAQTRPGDWSLTAYLLNTATLYNTGIPPAERLAGSLVAGPVRLDAASQTLYRAQGVLDADRDASGAAITSLVARIVYGPANSEQRYSGNTLALGEPALRYASVANAARPGAEDIITGERAQVTVRAQSGLTLAAYLINPDNPDTGTTLAAGPFALAESTNGNYSGEQELARWFDKAGNDLSRVQAVVFAPGTPHAPVWSLNTLAALRGDATPPAAPLHTVVASAQSPSPGAETQTTITWTAPETDRGGTPLADLAGYHVYRVQMLPPAADLAYAPGSPPPGITGNGDGTVALAAAFVESQGTVYNSAYLTGEAVGWLAPGAKAPASPAGVTPAPGENISVCALSLNLTGALLFPAGAARATVYTQQPRIAVEQWIAQLRDWGAAADGQVIACSPAYYAQDNGFAPAPTLESMPYYSYEKITASPVVETVFTDTYANPGVTWSHAAAAADTAGNVSFPAVAAAVPASSLLVTDAQLSNAPGAPPTGYAQPGDSVLVDVALIPEVDPAQAGASVRLVNKTALADGASLLEAYVGGPVALQADPQAPGRYTALHVLDTLTDAGGRTAAELALVISIPGWENITGSSSLKGGVAPVRTAAAANASRPGKTNIRVGESIEITAQGNSGLALRATLVDPGSGELLDAPALTLAETPAGSGRYTGQAVLLTNLGEDTQPIRRLTARISDALGRVDPHVPGGNSLDLLPALHVTGTVVAQPGWLLPGWNLDTTGGVTNNGAETLDGAQISVSLINNTEQKAYTVSQSHTLAPGAALTGLAFSHGPVFLAPGIYTAALDLELDGFTRGVAQTQIEIVADMAAGTLTTDRPVYLSGETMTVDFTANNVSSRTLDSLNLELRLRDETGALINSSGAGALTNWPAGAQHTGSLTVQTPAGLLARAGLRLELAALINGNEDTAAEKTVSVLPEQIQVTGLPIPDHVIQYQEPLFNFHITNQTRDAITQGLVTGEVHTIGWQPGEAPFASFTTAITNLPVRGSATLTGIFSPVGAQPGEYRIVIFTQAGEGAPRIQAMESPLWVESCEP